MNILITGGLGYIGSHLLKMLRYHEITIIDNLYTQRYTSLFNPTTTFKFIEQDFQNTPNNILKNTDFVMHLAAICDASKSFEQQKEINQINTENTRIFFNRCADHNVKIIFPSSTSVYGKSTDIVYEDDDSVINPQSPYAESKIIIEKVLQNMEHCIFRFGTVYGVSPGIRFQTAINKFCFQAAFDQPLTVWRQNIHMKRPYLSLHELGLVVAVAINCWDKFKNQTFNILDNNLSPDQIISIIQSYKDIMMDLVDCPLLNQYSYIVSNNKINQIHNIAIGRTEWEIKETLKLLGITCVEY